MEIIISHQVISNKVSSLDLMKTLSSFNAICKSGDQFFSELRFSFGSLFCKRKCLSGVDSIEPGYQWSTAAHKTSSVCLACQQALVFGSRLTALFPAANEKSY